MRGMGKGWQGRVVARVGNYTCAIRRARGRVPESFGLNMERSGDDDSSAIQNRQGVGAETSSGVICHVVRGVGIMAEGWRTV